MSLEVAVTDLANGGGVSVAVTGSSGSVTVKCYDPENGWQTLGTRTGDGAVTGTVQPGLHWWYALNGATVSPIVPKYITRSSQAIYDLCLQAVTDTISLAIIAGSVPALTGVHRQRKLRIDAMEDAQPCAVVLPANPSMQPVTNERDQITYPCQIIVLDNESPQAEDDEDNNSAPYHLINERLTRLFSQQRLPGVSIVDVCRVEKGNHFEWQNNAYDEVQSTIIVNCLTREPRGV